MTTERKRALPPIPSELTVPSRTLQLQAAAQVVQDKKRRQTEEEKKLAAAMKAAQDTQSSGNGFLRALDRISLPFEAFSESINALIGPAIPQKAFQERSARSRAILKAMFSGDIEIGDAAEALREVSRERSLPEQLITGFLFDPLNIIIPGAFGAKAAVRAASMGVGAAAKAGAVQAARTAVEITTPFGAGAIKTRLGLERAVQKVTERSNDVLGSEILGVEFAPRGTVGAARSIWSEEEAHEFFRIGGAAAARNSEVLLRLRTAADSLSADAGAAIRLAMDTAGREAEIATIRIEDIDWVNGSVQFWDKAHKHPSTPMFVDADTLAALQKVKGSRTEGWLFPVTKKTQRSQKATLQALPAAPPDETMLAKLRELNRGYDSVKPKTSEALIADSQRQVVALFGDDRTVRLYRGLRPRPEVTTRQGTERVERLEAELARRRRFPTGSAGEWWTQDRALAELYTAGKGDLLFVDVKASELANRELVSVYTDIPNEWQLSSSLQARAKPITELLPETARPAAQPSGEELVKNPGGWYNRILQRVGQKADFTGIGEAVQPAPVRPAAQPGVQPPMRKPTVRELLAQGGYDQASVIRARVEALEGERWGAEFRIVSEQLENRGNVSVENLLDWFNRNVPEGATAIASTDIPTSLPGIMRFLDDYAEKLESLSVRKAAIVEEADRAAQETAIKRAMAAGARPAARPGAMEPAAVDLVERNLITGNIIRKLIATETARVLMSRGVSLSVVGRLLRHNPQELKGLLKHYVQLIPPDAPIFDKYVQVGAGGLDFTWKGGTPSPEWAGRLAAADEKLRVTAAPSKLDLAGIVARKGKKKSAREAAQEFKAIVEGRAKIADFELSKTRANQIAVAELSAREQEIIRTTYQALEAAGEILHIDGLADWFRLAGDAAGQATPAQRAYKRMEKAAREEAAQLALGIEDIFKTTLGKARVGAKAGLGILSDIWDDMMKEGLMHADDVREQKRALGMVERTAAGELTEDKVRYVMPHTSLKKLETFGLPNRNTYRGLPDPLLAIERATPDDAKAAADHWLRYNPLGKETTGVRAFLRAQSFNISDEGKIIGNLSDIQLRLTRLAQRGTTTQHIFGKDILPLTEEERRVRVRALVVGLQRSGNIIPPDMEAAKLKKLTDPAVPGIEEVEAAAAGAPPVTPDARPVPAPADPNWIDWAVGVPSTDEFYETQIRPNKRYADWADRARQKALDNPGHSVYNLWNHVARQLLEVATLRSASAKGFGKAIAMHESKVDEWSGQVHATLQLFQGLPGWVGKGTGKGLAQLVDDVNDANPQHFRVPIRAGVEDIDFVEKWVNSARGAAKYAGMAKRDVAVDLLQHNMSLFDGARGVPLARLADIYDVDADIMDAIIQTRNWPKKITDITIKMLGPKGKEKFEKLIKQAALDEYFPSVGKNINLQDIQYKQLGKKPDTWTQGREILNPAQAVLEQQEYLHPLASAAHYAATAPKYAMDMQFIQKVKRADYTMSAARYRNLQSQAHRLSWVHSRLLAGESIAEDEKGVRKLQTLLALKKAPREEFAELGRLADEVLQADEEKLKALAAPVKLAVEKAEKAQLDAKDLKKITGGIPGLQGIQFSSKVEAYKARDYLQEQNKMWMTVLRSTNKVSTGLRFLRAGVDFSTVMIHGLPSFFARPKDWMVATKGMLRAAADPEYLREYMNLHFQTLREFRHYGGVTNFLEPYEGVGWVKSMAEQIPFAGRKFNQLADRAEVAFSAWQTIARVEMWKALKGYGKMDDGKLAAVAEFVNKMTGVYNPTRAGLPTVQRYMESSFLSFAPMYRRAAYGLLTSAFTGGEVTRELLRDNMVHAVAAGAVLFGIIPYYTGNNPEALDPTTPKFLSWYDPMSGRYIGIGSAYYSLMRMIGASTEMMVTPEGRESFKPFDVYDNPLLKFWRGQAPVLPSMVLDDIILGRTYLGEPLRGEDGSVTPAAFLRMIREAITPIMLESVIEGSAGEKGGPINAAIGLEGFGARSFPESLYDVRRKLQANYLSMSDDTDIVAWRAQREREKKPILYSAMPVLLKNRLKLQYADLASLDKQINEQDVRTGRDKDRERALFFQQLTKNQEQVREGLQGIANSFSKDYIDARQFRNMVSEWGKAGIELNQSLGRQYPEIIGQMNEERTARIDAGATDAFDGDRLYDLYYTGVVLNKENTNEDGIFLPDRFERADLLFREQVGETMYQYVQERRRQAKQVPDLLEEFLDAREQLKPYWNLKDRLWRKGSEDWELMDAYLGLAGREQGEYAVRNPRVKLLNRQLDRARTQYRQEHSDADFLLAKWYGNIPQTDRARTELAKWKNYQMRNARTP